MSRARLVYRFAWLISKGQATRSDAAVLKLYTGEAYKAVSDLGLQILGGYGYCMEYPMQRFFRDSRLAVIGGGHIGDPAQHHRAGTGTLIERLGFQESTRCRIRSRASEYWSSARSSPAPTAAKCCPTWAPR